MESTTERTLIWFIVYTHEGKPIPATVRVMPGLNIQERQCWAHGRQYLLTITDRETAIRVDSELTRLARIHAIHSVQRIGNL